MTTLTAEHPSLSVVMVTWNSLRWIPESLGALQASVAPGTLQLIVVDNASTDGTCDYLRDQLPGDTLIALDRNTGFGGACNLGALHARGRFLCFLNPDALVTPGWMEQLLEVFEDPRVGIAAPMLINPDGTVQEAGAIVTSGGKPYQFGHGDQPSEQGFQRRVVAVSGACLTIRADAFHSVGGFDPLFYPAYCEDTDLCLEVRHGLGLDVVYCPRTRVTHVSQGSVQTALADELMRSHAALLWDKWSSRLGSCPTLEQLYARRSIYWAARDALTTARILIVASEFSRIHGRIKDLADLAAENPDSRLTLLTRDAQASVIEDAGRKGLEVSSTSDWDRWLDERFGHYTLAVLEEELCTPEDLALVTAAQPRSLRATVAELCSKPPIF